MPQLLFNPLTGEFDFVRRPGEGGVIGEHPTGDINGINVVFTLVNYFRADKLALMLNGQRLTEVSDYVLSESGGVGSGYDRITTTIPPRPGDVLLCDYLVV